MPKSKANQVARGYHRASDGTIIANECIAAEWGPLECTCPDCIRQQRRWEQVAAGETHDVLWGGRAADHPACPGCGAPVARDRVEDTYRSTCGARQCAGERP